MAVTAAVIGVAATVASTAYSRTAQHDAKVDAQHQAARAQQGQEDIKKQQEVTAAARAARAQQQAMAGGSYASTIGTSPLGLSGGSGSGATTTREKLGE
jgi:Tfp pilus assembly protein PilE